MGLFRFKRFSIDDTGCAMKIGTDGVLLGAWVNSHVSDARNVIDVGAGCGLIGIMIANKFRDTTVDFVEIDKSASETASQNIHTQGLERQCTVHNCNIVDFKVDRKYDLIVSNPPFFLNGVVAPCGARAMARHAGELSPTSLIDFAVDNLTDYGLLAMIVPAEQTGPIEEYAVFKRLCLCDLLIVSQSASAKPKRAILGFSKCDRPREAMQLAIRTTDKTDYTPEYKALTGDYYINF